MMFGEGRGEHLREEVPELPSVHVQGQHGLLHLRIEVGLLALPPRREVVVVLLKLAAQTRQGATEDARRGILACDARHVIHDALHNTIGFKTRVPHVLNAMMELSDLSGGMQICTSNKQKDVSSCKASSLFPALRHTETPLPRRQEGRCNWQTCSSMMPTLYMSK